MVRKKANDHKKQNPSQETTDSSKDSTFTKPPHPLSRQSSIEDPKEKLQNLKSLNSLLLKEAFESRQQIESLVQAKIALEDELSQRKKLEVEENEKILSFELQNESVYVYVETQMKELGDEREKMIGVLEKKVNELMGSLENEREMLSLVYKENDLMRKDFELQVKEFEKVKISMVKDKYLLEKNMKSKADEVEDLRRENEKIVREKKEIEIEKSEQRLKIGEMEKEMRGMNELISSLRKEDVTLRSKILKLEKDCSEAMNREAKRAIESLVEEKRANERSIEILMEEKDSMSRLLEAAMVESEDRQRRIEKLSEESDELISSLRKEDVTLRSKILKLEKDCSDAMNREAERAIEIELLVEEKRANERSIKMLMEEKDLVSRSLEAVMVESEDRQRRIEKLSEESDELILSLRKEDVTLRSKILKMEKDCIEAMNREAERVVEIESLVEEKRANERSIERLMEEKEFVSRSLEAAMVESEDRQRRIEKLSEESDAARRVLEMNEKEFKDMHKKIEELSRDKIEIEKAKIQGENESIELRNEVIELRNVVHRLQKECFDHQKKNNELISEVNHVKDLIDRTTLERDNALKRFDEEKLNSVNLTSKVSEMHNMLEKTTKELARNRNEKEEIANRIGSMVEDKDRLHKELFDAKRSLDYSRAKTESTTINYNRALTLLKNTASLVCQSSEEEHNIDDEPYVTELEAIKTAFKNKETVAQDLMLKVELMEKSTSFWTMVSSATMLFAAITMAYAAKGR